MTKINNFQQQVAKHITEKGFNCIIQKSFPNIVAWKPFEDSEGSYFTINANVMINGKVKKTVYNPFFITMVACSLKKSLSKKEISLSKQLLKEGRCNAFLLAYEDKGLQFKEIEGERKKIKKLKVIKKTFPSYLG
ncbi:MAG TPA: hypothetical protein VMZ91_14055 [Candidatus Paceibacterota bacterium]|nr:hypothetical protein [Candidatus Paceibacterota bacterium]